MLILYMYMYTSVGNLYTHPVLQEVFPHIFVPNTKKEIAI